MSLTATLKYGNEPMGTKSITENGTGIDVSAYAKVNVDVSPEVELQDKTVTTNGTVTADEGYDGLDTVTVNVQPTLQTKSATPTESAQEITADSGYDGLEKVNVGAIPSEYIVPSGTLNVTSNGTVSCSQYASVSVDVDIPEYASVPTEQKEDIVKVGTTFYLWRAS